MAADKIFGSENRRKLYDNLTKDGFDLGTFEDFDRNMNDDNVRRSIHEAAIDSGWDLPDYDQFNRDMSVRRMKIDGQTQEVDHATYDDFLKRHPSGSNKKSVPSRPTPSAKPQMAPAQTPTPPTSTTSVDEAPEDPVLGTPWGTEGSGTGKSKAYKPFAPGQVRETGDPGTPDYGIPYRPYTQMSAAARDEIYRQNDFAVKQIQQMHDEREKEQARRNQPLVDTGIPEANNGVIRTQGQWEDDLQKGVQDIGKKYVSPMVSQALDKAEKDWHDAMAESSKYAKGEGTELFGLKRANELTDPDKILQGLQTTLKKAYDSPEMKEQLQKQANAAGIPVEDYIQQLVMPTLQQQLESEFTGSMLAKSMPKNAVEYILQGMSNSIGGMLMGAAVETKSQRRIKNEAEAMTEQGQNPYYNPGTGAKLTKMGVSFAADAPFFGLYGRVSGQVAKQVAEREIQKLIGKGLSEGAARSIVGSTLENSVGARMKNYIMQHVISGSLTMGGYNATSEFARQTRDKEGYDPLEIAGSTAEGLAVGSAFGLIGGASQALSQPLSGFSKVGAKLAGFGAEAETMYATEELAKMVHGEEGFTNPFEGSLEALEKLGVMKLSGGHLLESGANKLIRAKEVGTKQVVGETLAEMFGPGRTGVKFSEEEQNYIRNSQEGKILVESLTSMHPDVAIEEVNGKKRFTKAGDQLRRQLSENYDRFMNNTEIPSDVKAKVAKMLGGVYRPGLETGADIIQNEDGSVILKTRDKDGNCIHDIKFDTLEEAQQWQEAAKSEFSRNDAVNMWNNASEQARQNIVNIIKDIVSGKATIDELQNQSAKMMSDAAGMTQNRLRRQLGKIDKLAEQIKQTTEQYEGREMTDEEARNYIQTVIRDGSDEMFNEMYQLIHDNAHPADEYNPKRNYWEGQQLSPLDRHIAQVDAQLAEEQLRYYFGDAYAEDIIAAANYPDEKIAELASNNVSADKLKAAIKYYNATAKVAGMMDQALKSIDNQVEAANAYIRKNTHADSGSMIETNYHGRDCYITAGHFQITPDGKLVPTDNSGLVILRDKNTGEIVTANPNDLTVTNISDPNRLIDYNESMEGLRGQLIKQADDSIELHPDTPEMPIEEDYFIGSDGKQYVSMKTVDEQGNPVWMKMAVDADGIATGEPQPLDIEEYRKAKSDAIDQAEMPQNEILSPENDQIEQNQSENEQIEEKNAQNQEEIIPEVAGEPKPASTTIPVDESGKKLYEQAKPEDTLAELTKKYGEEQARKMIAQIAQSTAKALEELQNRDTSKITDMSELEAIQDEIAAAQKKADYWQNIVRQREAAEAMKQQLIKTQIANMRKAKDIAELEAAIKAAIKAGVPENELSEVYNAKKAWNNLVNPEKITNFATDPESQAKWVDEHMKEIVDTYIKAHGNLLDPDKIRNALTPIGYNGKNVPDFKLQGKRLTKATYEKMLRDAVESGNTSITLLTGAGGAGKSKATESMDFSDRGIVYDSAFNNISSLDDAISTAKKAGMNNIQVVAVYNDAPTSFGNTIERGLRTGRFLSLDYFVREAFTENKGKIAELRKLHPDVDIVCIDNSGNKSTERPERGRVSADDAVANWDYTVNDAKLNELLDIFENGINEGRFTEDQAASIGRGLRNVTRAVADITADTIERISRIERGLRGQDDGDLRSSLPRGTSGLGGHNVVPAPDGEIQGSPEERKTEGESGAIGKGTESETRTDEEAGNGGSDGSEPPTAGTGSLRSRQHGPSAGGTGSNTEGGTGMVSGTGNTRGGSEARSGRGSGSSGNDAGGTGERNQGEKGTAAGTEPLKVDQATGKLYQKRVEANIGRTFTFSKPDGGSAVLTIHRIDHIGNAVLTRQDYDANGNAVGEPREVKYHFTRVADAIGKGTWKKHLNADEELRQSFKYHNRKKGDIPIIDVMTDEEKQQMLDALRRGDTEEAGRLEGDILFNHFEDVILRGRDLRNEKVERALRNGSKAERLRAVRELYKNYPDAVAMLEDGVMEPQSIEEYVADAFGDVPKMGKGFLAYTSYDKGGNKIVGLKDETGFGSRGFGGDTKALNPWLASKGQGISLKQFAEQIHETLPEGLKDQYTDQDIRNIIDNIVRGAEKPTDIANYILSSRIEQAEAAARHAEEELINEGPAFQKMAGENTFAGRLQRAKDEVNTEPTEGQKKAGNYKKGHISFGGYDYTIENIAGSMRRGTDANGKQWEQKMNNTYGYILGKRGKDGDHLDMFINDKADLDNWNGNVYVVDQINPDGSFDEHKILYGFNSEAEAREAYLSNYEKGWKGLGKITGVDKQTFDKWIDSSDRKIKQFADHSIVKHKVEQQMTNFNPAVKELNTRGISIDNPELLEKYGLKNVVLSKTGDHLTLTHFIVDQQGQGYGTRFMEDLARLADEKGWTLALTPGLGFGAKSKKRLADFYKRFGFVPNKGRNADFQTREAMIRRPKDYVEKPEDQEKIIRDAVVEHLKSIGVNVSTDWQLGQKILDDYNGGGKLSESKKRALDTVVPRDNSPFKATAVSSADGAKVLKNLETLAKKSENLSIRGKNSFIGDVADALGAQMKGSKSKYAKFETDDGTEVIIRLADHNATVSQFDYKGEDNGISIVISRKPNKGITNDGDARLVEVFYPDKALKKAEGNPYAEIVKSISNALHTGNYKDTTGLAEREEVNAGEIKQHKTKFFKTADGYAYGYTLGGKIYVDPRIATSETPIHEYGHLYCSMKRQTDPEGWKEWKKVMFGDKLVQPIIDKVKRDYPELEGKEDDFAEEIITQFSGKRGSERLREIAEEVAKEKGGIFGKAEAVTAMQRLKSILNRFWEGVANMMGWKYKNANQIADRIMADMLNGVDPTRMAKDARRLRPQAEPPRSQKVDYTSKEEIEKTKTIFDAAKNLFGTTRDVREAGYILPDGTMPDFSGRHLMDPGSDTSFLRGRRATDHREVQSLAYEKDGETETGIKTDMPDFIRRGAIRIDDNAGSINLATKPTAKQKSILRQLIARNDGYVQVDFGDGWDSDHYVEYDEAKPSKVLADIDRYFDEGIKPDGGPKFQKVENDTHSDNFKTDLRFQRVGNPEPEMTPEERQYWNKWEADMKKWKERNAIGEYVDGPGEKPRYQQGELAIEYGKRLTKWMQDKALWQTAPKIDDYLKKREDKDLLEAARENEKRYPDSPLAKMRRVAAELQQIRTAMSQQKAYDKATVKAVTDFAQDFMKLGFGDNLSRGEIERMLSSVKNATGARDIKKEVDNIMNILISNHLRNLDQRVTKLSSTKELSKTAQGVEKQGKLELKGQKMIRAFRDARQNRMTADEIRERMEKVAEKMNRNDEEAPMWEQEYEGLSIALQYADNIEASRQEYADLDREYKDAVKEYRTSGRSYKAQQELLEALEQAMQENQIERIGMFGDVIGRLEGNIAESMQGAKEFVEREKQRVKHIYSLVNFDLAGKDAKTSRREDRMDRVLKNDMLQLAFSPLATFEQMLKQFGTRNVKGEGNLYNYFMRNYIDSVNNAYTGTVKAREELDAKAKEIFGDKVKHWSDLYSITSKPGMDITYLDGEQEISEKLSQGNMLYIYMANKMSDGKMKLRKMGITEEDVDAIKEALDPRLVQLGDWLQGEYLPQKRTEYNKVHERMFGAPMAAIENYFPIKVNRDAAYQDAEKYITSEEGDRLPSSITGSIIKRKKNALPLDILHTDALSLAMEHLEEMEQWKAQAEFNRDVKDLLSNTTFRNKVKNMKTIYGSGTPLWNKFFDAATIATGDYSPKRGIADKTITNIAKGVTAAKINFRAYTAFKQLLSLPAFFTDVTTADMAKAMLPQNYFYNNFKWAMENMPVFKKRWESRQIGDTRLMDDPSDWKVWKNDAVKAIQKWGMMPNATIDALTCAAGAKAIYDTRYKKYKEIGASDEIAKKRALQDAAIGYNLTQQSNEGAFTSAIQRDRTVAANALSVFRNSSMSYTRQSFDAMRNLYKMSQKGYKEDSIEAMTHQFEHELGLDEDQARKAAEMEYAKAGRHELAKMLNMMFGVTILWNLGSSLPYLLFGDDDKTKKEMLTDAIAKGIAAGPTEGLAGGNIWSDIMSLATNESVRKAYASSLGKGWAQTRKNISEYEINPLPLLADLDKLIGKTGRDGYEAAQDLFNIAAQSYTGVNPQTITDIWNAAMDYGNPSWMPFSDASKGNEDLANSKEIALFIMRVLNAPTSSWRNKYIDELGMNAEDAKKLPYEEMARRYANYKHWKDAPLMGWLRDDESRQAKMDKIQKQFDKAVEERMARLTDEELMHNVARSESPEEKRKYAKLIAQRLGIKPGEDSQKPKDDEWYQNTYQKYMLYEDIKEDEILSSKISALDKIKDELSAEKKELLKEIDKRTDWIRDGKYDSKNGRKGKHKDVSKEPDLLEPGKKQFYLNGDEESNKDAIMKNIRKWRKEALEMVLRAEK